MSEIQAQDGIARPEEGGHRSGIGLGARVRLHVGVLGAEQRRQPVDGQLLDHVNVLAAAVVPPAGIALGVLVGQHRALGPHDRDRSEVLAGDHLERGLLPGQFGRDGPVHLGVSLCQGPVEYPRRCDGGLHSFLNLDDHAGSLLPSIFPTIDISVVDHTRLRFCESQGLVRKQCVRRCWLRPIGRIHRRSIVRTRK
jgi:hypothetical protein